jgi:Copper chaperone
MAVARRLVEAVTNEVKGVDQKARVQIDLARHRVEIAPGSADAHPLSDAIEEAGDTPVPASNQPVRGCLAAQARRRRSR